jgi:hypothetical protein
VLASEKLDLSCAGSIHLLIDTFVLIGGGISGDFFHKTTLRCENAEKDCNLKLLIRRRRSGRGEGKHFIRIRFNFNVSGLKRNRRRRENDWG